MINITVAVDDETARSFESASQTQQREVQRLIQLYFRKRWRSLDEIMEDASNQATRNGLTPEILEAILQEDDES